MILCTYFRYIEMLKQDKVGSTESLGDWNEKITWSQSFADRPKRSTSFLGLSLMPMGW